MKKILTLILLATLMATNVNAQTIAPFKKGDRATSCAASIN